MVSNGLGVNAVCRLALMLSVAALVGCGGGGNKDSAHSSSHAAPSSPASALSSQAVSDLSSQFSSQPSSDISSQISSQISSETVSVIASAPASVSASAVAVSSVSSLAQCLAAAQQLATDQAPLAQLSITTDTGAPIVDKENYLTADYAYQGAAADAQQGRLEIRGRGNSTWDWQKKPYRLKLDTAAAFGALPSHRHWVLLANYADKTLVRNEATLHLAQLMGMRFTPRSQAVELQLNGAYQGVYQLTEHIRVGKNRVDIAALEVEDTQTPAVTGGYLLEVDFRMSHAYCTSAPWDVNCVAGENLARASTYCIDSEQGMAPACVDTPDSLQSEAWSAQRSYITTYMQDFERALFGAAFDDPEQGYRAYLDVASAVDYYLLNEFVKNPDGATTSFWLYKDRGQKLALGPVWDFDLASGNAGYSLLDQAEGWHTRQGTWFARLLSDPWFAERVASRWQELKDTGVIDAYFAFIAARTQALQVAQAANYCVWPLTDFADWIYHPVAAMGNGYQGEVDYLLDWQRRRFAWLDAQWVSP